MPRSFTFVCQLYCCSSKHNNKALRITFNSCKTVSTSSMALATVNIDKIIKVTSASSYVYCTAYTTIYATARTLAYTSKDRLAKSDASSETFKLSIMSLLT